MGNTIKHAHAHNDTKYMVQVKGYDGSGVGHFGEDWRDLEPGKCYEVSGNDCPYGDACRVGLRHRHVGGNEEQIEDRCYDQKHVYVSSHFPYLLEQAISFWNRCQYQIQVEVRQGRFCDGFKLNAGDDLTISSQAVSKDQVYKRVTVANGFESVKVTWSYKSGPDVDWLPGGLEEFKGSRSWQIFATNDATSGPDTVKMQPVFESEDPLHMCITFDFERAMPDFKEPGAPGQAHTVSYTNAGKVEQTFGPFVHSKVHESSSRFEHTHGFKLWAQAKFSWEGGALFAKAGFELSTGGSSSHNWTTGETKTNRENTEIHQSYRVPPMCRLYARLMRRETLLRVPFTQCWWHAGECKSITGVFNYDSTEVDVQVTYKELPPADVALLSHTVQEDLHSQEHQQFLRSPVPQDYAVPSWLDKQRPSFVNVGVVGVSGKGKSLLINRLRGVIPKCSSWAPVGVNETTKEPTPYEFLSDFPSRIWDLPGVGTPLWPHATYIQRVGLKFYDVVVVVVADRFSESDSLLFQHAQSMVPCFCVRTKVDIDIRNNQINETTSEDTLAQIRSSLRSFGVKEPWLVSNVNPEEHDFPRLREALVESVRRAFAKVRRTR